MRLLLHIAVLCSIVFVGCTTDKRTAALIRHAEDIAIEHPDSALRVIRSIDPRALRGDHDIAHYQLVYSESLYYNIIDSDNDSLTRPMAEYYLYDDNHAERARAMYQHAIVRVNAKNNAEAMYYLNEAEKSLEHTDNPRLAGIVHRQKGEIYGEECLFARAIKELEIAIDYFEQENLNEYIAYSMFSIGDYALHNRQYDYALEHLSNARDYAIAHNNQNLLNYVLLDYAYIYVDLNEYDKCAFVIEDVKEEYLQTRARALYFSLKSVVASYKHDFTSASEFIEKCSQCNGEVDAYVKYAQAKQAELNRDYKSAHLINCEIIKEQDKLVLRSLNSPLFDLEVEFIERDLDKLKQENLYNRAIYISIVVITILIVTIIVLFLYFRIKQYRRDINTYINTISELELIRRENQPSVQFSETIESLYKENLDEINQLCEIYYTHIDTPRQAVKVFEHVHKIIETLKSDTDKISKLESAVNASINNAMMKLREHCQTLTEREFRITLYTLAGFSNRAICLLVGCKSETLPKIKYKIREQIKNSNLPDAEMFISYLSNKKH